MNTDPAPSEPGLPARHSLGRPQATGPDDTHDGTPGAWFAVVLRGYDRSQVDARLAELDRRIRDEILRADTAESALAAARAHLRRMQDGVAGVPGASVPRPDSRDAGPDAERDERGFGLRVERVLQAAEREAADLRTKAAAEAASLVDNARAEAETQRQRTEEALLGRAAKLDQEFTTRSAALDARESTIDRLVEEARREADEIRSEAERAAAVERSDAERRSIELKREAEEDVERERAGAARELDRLTGVRDEVRGELARLDGLLRGELDREPETASLPGGAALFHDVRGLGTIGELGDVRDIEDTADRREVDGDPLTGTLRLAPEPRDAADDLADGDGSHPDGEDANARTAVGTIPPYTVASIGVLPFGDRSAGGPANGRSFTFELAPGSADDHDRGDGTDGLRTSEDIVDHVVSTGPTPTRSTMPTRGRR